MLLWWYEAMDGIPAPLVCHAISYGLDESFTQTRAQIPMMDPIHSSDKVFSIVVQEERQ